MENVYLVGTSQSQTQLALNHIQPSIETYIDRLSHRNISKHTFNHQQQHNPFNQSIHRNIHSTIDRHIETYHSLRHIKTDIQSSTVTTTHSLHRLLVCHLFATCATVLCADCEVKEGSKHIGGHVHHIHHIYDIHIIHRCLFSANKRTHHCLCSEKIVFTANKDQHCLFAVSLFSGQRIHCCFVAVELFMFGYVDVWSPSPVTCLFRRNIYAHHR